MTRSLWLRIVAPAVSVLIVAAGCGNGSSGGNNNSGQLAADQTFKFPIFGDFGSLDPAILDAETDFEIAQNLFDNLLVFDNNMKITPDLAATMPDVSSDGMTYTFKLRHDVTFSNGDKFTSKDVLYSWNRAAALQGAYATNLAPIVGFDTVAKNQKSGADLEKLLEAKDPSVTMSGLTAPDDYTVQAKLSHPAGWWLSAISLQASTGAIVDVNAVKQNPDNWWTDPATLVGTGPFKMTAYTPKQSAEFTAVSNWWGSPKPTLKKVHLDIVQNIPSGITSYEQGQYDAVGLGGYSNLPIDQVLRIQGTANEKNQLVLQPKVRSYWVSFNVTCDAARPAKGPFCPSSSAAAKAAREAFALSIDKNEIVNVVCHNVVCKPLTGGLIVKGLDGYLGDNQDPLAKFDLNKAKQDLATAKAAGLSFDNLSYAYDPNNPINTTTAQALQDQWQRNLGVHVNLQAVDHSPFIKARLKGTYILSRDGWQADYNNPQDWYDNLWGHVVGCPDSGCSSGYTTDQYNSTLDKADSESGQQALNDYNELGKMLESDVVYIPLYYTVGAFLFKPYVRKVGNGTNNFFDNHWDLLAINKH
jgi:oligopeptide transport system substrate-binding protein